VQPSEAIGWREWIALPDFGDTPMKAKIDTGARTSSLHAFNLRVDKKSDPPIATFEVHPFQRSKRNASKVSLPVAKFVKVRSSSGHVEKRPVVRTRIIIGKETHMIEITLTSRDAMGFRALVGRSAVRHRFLVDPGRSYIQGDPV
jgi:hypothetical protein